jgi:hypothetical protein
MRTPAETDHVQLMTCKGFDLDRKAVMLFAIASNRICGNSYRLALVLFRSDYKMLQEFHQQMSVLGEFLALVRCIL